MNRPVTGADGRVWTLRSQLEWRKPATADDFEHDVAGGYAAVGSMSALLVVLTLVLIIWRPDDVIVPGWVILIIALVVLFFPIRWLLRRPWTVVAETYGDPETDKPAERWVGTVRGMFGVRSEIARIRRSIEREALPSFSGPLHPVE